MLKETAILSTVNVPSSQLTPKTTIVTNNGFQETPKTTTAISTPVSAMTPFSMKSSPIHVSSLTSKSFKLDIEGMKKIPSKISTKVLEEDGSNDKLTHPLKSFKKLEDNKVIENTHSRPQNPFAKSPRSNEGKPSIFDSLKKTKKNEDVKKVISNKKFKV